MTYPKTADELLALPIGPAFGSEERIIDGRLRIVPIAQAMRAFVIADDMALLAVDAAGDRWSVGQYADGNYYRRLFLA